MNQFYLGSIPSGIMKAVFDSLVTWIIKLHLTVLPIVMIGTEVDKLCGTILMC
jgi:hypothetical protein